MRATRSRFETASSRCCAPSWRSRPTRRRSASAASITRARDSSSARAWLRRSSSADARAAKIRSAATSSSLGLHRARVEHREVAEVHVLGGAQADREVALEARARPPACRPGSARSAPPGTRPTGSSVMTAHGWPAVSYSNGSSMKAPSYQQTSARDVLAGGVVRLGDQDQLGRERLGDVAGEAAQELLARPRPRCPRRRRAAARGRGADRVRRSWTRPRSYLAPSGHAEAGRLMRPPSERRCHPHATRDPHPWTQRLIRADRRIALVAARRPARRDRRRRRATAGSCSSTRSPRRSSATAARS